jgi:hypothetical protein
MIDEHLDRAFKMLRVHDQQPVQTFGPNGSHEPFRDPVRLRRLKRRPNHTYVVGLEHGVKAAREFGIAITDQKSNRRFPFD